MVFSNVIMSCHELNKPYYKIKKKGVKIIIFSIFKCNITYHLIERA